jgi:hypothetical protein
MFQKLFDETFQRYLTPAFGLQLLILDKLNRMGLKVDKRFREDLMAQIEKSLSENSGTLTFDLDGRRLKRLNPKADLTELQNIAFEETDYNQIEDLLAAKVQETTLNFIELSIDEVLKSVRKTRRGQLSDARKFRKGFEARLEKRWRQAIDVLEQLIGIAFDLGAQANVEGRQHAVDHNDIVFEALIRLQARACRTATEVLVLIRAGLADGAHARWRSLHELAVVAIFVNEGSNDLANRYLLHEPVESLKAARELNRLQEETGHDPIPDADIAGLETRVAELKAHFGDAYGEQWGWASVALNNNPRPTFAQIEEAVGLRKWRPYYRMASHNVHAGPKGVRFTLGLINEMDSFLLAGPSDTGFADPAHGTAISLFQITGLLLMRTPGLDSLIQTGIMQRLVDEVGECFLEIQKKYEKEYLQ